MPRFEQDRCFLAVIDVQQAFLDKLLPSDRAPLTERIAWLIRAATALDIPVLTTAEDPGTLGPPAGAILGALPKAMMVHDKHLFGLAGQADILATARALNRPQAVLAGLETDVSVAQSALGLQTLGFRVAALSDATAAPGPCHDAGLGRMRDAGITITTIKGMVYEWARDPSGLSRLGDLRQNLPEGVTL